MRKKLVRHGNSRALVFDKTMLELLGIGEDDELEITIEGSRLGVRRATSPEEHDRAFLEAAEACERRYEGLLKRLAE